MTDSAPSHHSPPLADIDGDGEVGRAVDFDNLDLDEFIVNIPATQAGGVGGDEDGVGKNDSQSSAFLGPVQAAQSQSKTASPMPDRPTTAAMNAPSVSPQLGTNAPQHGTKRKFDDIAYHHEEDELEHDDEEPLDPTAEVVPFDAVKAPNEDWMALQHNIKKTLQDVANKMITDVFELVLGISHDLHGANTSTRRSLVEGLNTVKKEEERHIQLVQRFKEYSDFLARGKSALLSPPMRPEPSAQPQPQPRNAFRADMHTHATFTNTQGHTHAHANVHVTRHVHGHGPANGPAHGHASQQHNLARPDQAATDMPMHITRAPGGMRMQLDQPNHKAKPFPGTPVGRPALRPGFRPNSFRCSRP